MTMTMSAMNRVLFVCVMVGCTLSGCLSAVTVTTTPSPVDINTAARQLVKDIRTAVTEAKSGQYLHIDYQNFLNIQTTASDLLQSLPDQVSECQTNLILKMAAAGTGSHEVLTLLVAEDASSVLNGRLSLSLAVLEHVAGQLEDELTKDVPDVGAYLAAIIFGADATTSIITTAENTIKSMQSGLYNSMAHAAAHNRVRRQGGNYNLGSGWSVGLGGITWQNKNVAVSLKPVVKDFKLTGAKLVIRF